MARYDITLREVRYLLHIEVDAQNNAYCPFCAAKGDKPTRRTLHMDDTKNQWNCPKCGAHGGVLRFFAMYQLGYADMPSDKAERKKISQELQRMLGCDDTPTPHRRNAPTLSAPPPPKNPLACDDILHSVYTAMAALPVFQLTPEHKRKLKERGLTGSQIERNGYRTFPSKKITIPDAVKKLYCSTERTLRDGIRDWEAYTIQFGMYVAKELQDRGHKLSGIPGFYKFGEHWCLTFIPGILIPTRNMYGQIIAWQIRKEKGSPKYLTLSCGSKPGAVDSNDVSRCHFPIANATPSEAVRLYITEGPLKADVALALTKEPCAFAAIPGVKTQKDLLDNLERLCAEKGIRTVYNALDMDRITNQGVREGSVKLKDELQKRGIQLIPIYWGKAYATETLKTYQMIAYLRCVQIPPYDPNLPVYEKLDITAKALTDADIDPGKATPESQHWESKTKGIDDYLFSLIERKEHTHRERTNNIRAFHKALLEINKPST